MFSEEIYTWVNTGSAVARIEKYVVYLGTSAYYRLAFAGWFARLR